MNKTLDILNLLKAMAAYYHSAHLAAKFYSQHLLFDRLAEKLHDEIDSLSELAMALDIELVLAISGSLNAQLDIFEGLIETSKATPGEVLKQALDLELAIVQNLNDGIKSAENEGVKNALAGMAENHLRNVYLLKQSFKGVK